MSDERRRSAAIGCAVGVAAAGVIALLVIEGDPEAPDVREPPQTPSERSSFAPSTEPLESGPGHPTPAPARIPTATALTPAKIDADRVKAELEKQAKAEAEAKLKAEAEAKLQAAAALKVEQEAAERERRDAEAGVFPALSGIDKKNSYGGLLEAGNRLY